MSGKLKNGKIIWLETYSYFVLMFKVGGGKFTPISFFTSFVCGQQIDIDTDLLLCAIQQQTQRKHFTKIINSLGYLIVEIFLLSNAY